MCRKKNAVARAPAPKDKVNVKSKLGNALTPLPRFSDGRSPGLIKRPPARTSRVLIYLLRASMGPSCMSMGASQRRHHPSHAADHVSTRVRAAGYLPLTPKRVQLSIEI
jgi:hypothetical protein